MGTLEIWKDIPGYEGLYQASTYGNIKSMNYNHTGKEKNLSNLHKNWYITVHLLKKSHKLHRIIANIFIPNSENKSEVNHRNGIKTDNRVENLEWVTKSENMIHAIKTGLVPNHHFFKNNPNKGKYGALSSTSRSINQYSLSGEFIQKWGSIIEAGTYLNIGRRAIGNCLSNTSKQSGGFLWEYSQAQSQLTSGTNQ